MGDTFFTCPRREEAGRLVTGVDKYVSPGGLVGQDSGCSYCGSMSAEDFMLAVHAGAKLGPTDKSYKIYLNGMHGKFYTHHFKLRTDLALEFRDMVLNREVHIGYPGYFYSRLWLPIDKPEDGRD